MAKSTKKPKKSTTKSPAWSDLNVSDVLYVSKEKSKIFLGREPLTEVDLKNLQAEIKALKQFKIWTILTETLKHKAIEKGMTLSENWEQTLSAKMMMHNIGIIKSIVDVLEKASFPAPKTNFPPRVLGK